MTQTSAAVVEALIAGQQGQSQLRLLTCGSVDDGKSTLIGRLLYDTRLLLDDQLGALEADSKTAGTQQGDLDFALLVDGLAAEREQGITIDVGYRFFATPRRKFIVADTPGHEQYTRNMVTGASTADLAILLVDARKGLLTQTRRHSTIVALLGLRHVVLAVNKMDLVDYDPAVFQSIADAYAAYARGLGIEHVTAIPLSALCGDNVVERSPAMPWYDGPALLPYLETVRVAPPPAGRPFRLPVQWVNRPHLDFRGFCGTVASGEIRPGDAVTVLPSGKSSRIKAIVTFDGDLPVASAGQAVTLLLDDEIDISRGDLLVAGEPPTVSDQLAAHLVWMDDQPMIPGRSYLFRFGPALVPGHVSTLKHQININTGDHAAARTLELNGVGFCNLALERPVAVDPYRHCRETGGFIVIDRLSNATVGAGMVEFGLRRADNLHWQSVTVDKRARGLRKNQTPCLLWFTGLSGAGKSAIANAVEERLHRLGHHTYLLDGDNVRHGLNQDLGFTVADRVENIRRVGEVSKLMLDAGLVVLAALISPFRSERRMVREMLEPGEFFEILVDTPLEVCERRDCKGLYAKARRGELKNFTGIDSPYEPSEAPELVLDTKGKSVGELADAVLAALGARLAPGRE